MKDTRNEKMLKLEQNYEIITNPEFLVNTREYGRCRCLNRQDLKDCTCHLLMCQELKKNGYDAIPLCFFWGLKQCEESQK